MISHTNLTDTELLQLEAGEESEVVALLATMTHVEEVTSVEKRMESIGTQPASHAATQVALHASRVAKQPSDKVRVL